ncbi:MAG TPA: porin, partial [Bacteroidales bacterium]|nr:porin [Bacteroidales bacterium]
MKQIKVFTLVLLIALLSSYNAKAQLCVAPPADGGLTVFGFLQPQIETSFNRHSTDYTFAFNRARIGVTGIIPYDFVYYAVVEAGPNFPETPYLLDVFISYQRFRWAQLTIGQFKSNFTLEMSTPCHMLHTINRSQVVNNLVSPDRDLGIMLSGTLLNDRLHYNMALTNGTGRGLRDNNQAKTFHSRIQVTPFEFLKLGGGIQYGKHPPADETIITEDSRLRWAADLQFNFHNFSLISEFISG